jgi:replication factor A1
MDFVDASGEIRATIFQEAVDRFYSVFEVGKVYDVSNAKVKYANKQFSAIKHDFELVLDSNTIVAMVADGAVSDIPQVISTHTSIVDILEKKTSEHVGA